MPPSPTLSRARSGPKIYCFLGISSLWNIVSFICRSMSLHIASLKHVEIFKMRYSTATTAKQVRNLQNRLQLATCEKLMFELFHVVRIVKGRFQTPSEPNLSLKPLVHPRSPRGHSLCLGKSTRDQQRSNYLATSKTVVSGPSTTFCILENEISSTWSCFKWHFQAVLHRFQCMSRGHVYPGNSLWRGFSPQSSQDRGLAFSG